jgi:hypothetical protein
MTEKFIKLEKDLWELGDGSLFEGSKADLPKSNASKIGGAGKTYPESWLKEKGWKVAKKAPAKKKAAPKKKVETKAVKPSENK